MVSHKYKCIFVHIPKTGGQSIESVFLHRHGLTWADRHPLLLRKNDDLERGPERLAHMTISEYLKYNYVSQQFFDKYFKFAVVRNPWDRLVSEYAFRQRRGEIRSGRTFKSWVSKLGKFKAVDIERHIKPQYDYIHDTSGKLLVDYIGKFENYGFSFNFICDRLSMYDCVLPHKNKSVHAHYTEYYDQDTVDLVSEVYAKDIELFKYKYGE